MKVIAIPFDRSEVDDLRSSGYDDDSIARHLKECVDGIVQEYKLMARLRDNPNVVHCDDLKTIPDRNGIGWQIWIKMELLRPLIKHIGEVSEEPQVIRLGVDLCRALEECWDRKVIHRDIKPQNIFISESGRFKLGDFGIARTMENHTTLATAKIGTLSFMAPEVYNNKPYGPSADQYSLGMVLYWLLNDRRGPFLPQGRQIPSASMEQEARERRFRGDELPPPAHGSAALKRIVLKACAFDPKDRYENPRQMLQALQALSSAGGKDSQEEEIQTADGTDQEQESVNSSGAVEVVSGDGEKKKPRWILPAVLALALIVTLAVCYFTIHFETTATCTEPSVCTLCGKELAPASGHQWSEASCVSTPYCLICGVSGGEPLGHDYAPATCEQPQTCVRCGDTVGEPLQHEMAAATCTEPKHCILCGAASGEALGHEWEKATFRLAKTCKVCGATEGEPLSSAGISVEDEILRIRKIYNEIMENREESYHRATLRQGVDAYYDEDNRVRCIVVYRGTDGISGYGSQYSRSYFYAEDGELVFAFYEGALSHRFYFYDGMLMRWRRTDNATKTSEDFDFDFTDEFVWWEEQVLTETAAFSSSSLPLSLCRAVEDSNQVGSTSDVAVGSWVDSFGNTHSSAIRFWVSGKSGWASTEYVTYRADRMYNRLTGSVSLGTESDSGATVWIRIYLDGVLGYESPTVGANTEQIFFELDTTGVRDIRIECETDLAGFAYGIVDAVLYQDGEV